MAEAVTADIPRVGNVSLAKDLPTQYVKQMCKLQGIPNAV